LSETLRVLLVEDSEDDAALTLRQLKKGGYVTQYERVDTPNAMRAALATKTWDIILSDYNMPEFSGSAALDVLRDTGIDIPFIIISGAIGEETAVEVMRAGAHDYIMKDNLARLVPAIERELREAEVRNIQRSTAEDLRLAAKVFENSVEGTVITDSEATILRVNKAFMDTTGYAQEEVVGKKPNILQSGRHDEGFYRHLWQSLIKQGYWQGEIWNRRKNGEIYPEWLTISAVHNEVGGVSHYIGGFTDLSQQKQAEERIQYLMYFDALTDLPNRVLFRDRFKQCMVQATHEGHQIAFLHLDLDRFIHINDTLGHQLGDQLLRQVGQRLLSNTGNHDVVARLGGDEFAIALPDLDESSSVEDKVQAIIKVFADPFRVMGKEVFLVPTVGVALFPDDTDNYDELVRCADTAVHYAKRHGGANYQLYHKSMNADVQDRLNMENALRRALTRQEFCLHYQPQVEVGSGRIIGVEALLRWQHAEMGMVLPGQFIPLLEETGLIIPVGEWVVRRACEDSMAWQGAGYAPIPVAVNLSARQFRNKGLMKTIRQVVEETGLAPQLLELEITESSVMDDPESALNILSAFHDMGIRIAIDDFGTGYSSLSYLKRFPLDVLKIDRSFVADIPGDADDAAIVETIIAMAHRLNLHVIAEGVETEEQVGFLLEHGCDHVQGYFYGRPMPAEELLKRLPR
jgi:diguanylate cyclase (GGDEF)-like protein/PAS domain S-box-containing protein